MTAATKKLSEQTRFRLLNAAHEAFSQNGFQGATVREICRRAETNVASVNYHFGSKDGLLAEALNFAQLKALQIANVKTDGSFKYDGTNHTGTGLCRFDDCPQKLDTRLIVAQILCFAFIIQGKLQRVLDTSIPTKINSESFITPHPCKYEVMTQYVHTIKQLFGLRISGQCRTPKASPQACCSKGWTGYADIPKTNLFATNRTIQG